jgi:hypothetical protein
VFEYHGWVAIRETAGLDDNDARLRQQVTEIQERLAELGDYGLLDLRWMNGAPFLHLAGKPNHRGAWGTAILDTFERAGQIAPGSYGLLYVWDDESNQYPNEFRVFKLARGQVTEHPDVLLSPVIPALEDARRDETATT